MAILCKKKGKNLEVAQLVLPADEHIVRGALEVGPSLWWQLDRGKLVVQRLWNNLRRRLIGHPGPCPVLCHSSLWKNE